jgi:hypothetical protein
MILFTISSEKDHAEAGRETENQETDGLPVTARVRRAEGRSSALGAGSGALAAGATVGSGTSAGGGGLGGHDTSTGIASLLHEALANTARRDSRLGGGVAVEVAGGSLVGAVLSLIVGVHDPAELLGAVAHAVRTVVAGGSVGSNTVTLSTITKTANSAEELANGVGADVRVGSAGDGVEHALAKLLVGGRGQRRGLGVPVAGLSRAGSGGLGGRVRVHLDTGRSDSGDLAGVVGEVGELADGVTVNGDKTVLVGLLEVHVDDTTGPDISHLVAVKDRDVGELARLDLVATVLGKEDRDIVVLEVLGLDVVTGLGEGRVTAPRVDVVAPEVDGLRAIAAVEVVGHLVADLTIVVGRVSNTDRAVVLGLDVCLHVTNGSLDESAGVGVVGLVGNLVTSEETESVVVRSHRVNDLGVTGVELIVPRRVVADDGGIGLGQIGDDVDASVCKHRHALVVVGGGVNGVDTDGVCAELLENGKITRAAGNIGEGVLVVTTLLRAGGAAVGGVLLLVGDTPHEAARC